MMTAPWEILDAAYAQAQAAPEPATGEQLRDLEQLLGLLPGTCTTVEELHAVAARFARGEPGEASR